MTQSAKKLLDEFDALADRDRSELVAELVRCVAR
jgi:metal-responsive CopG/Arc/MetJ family transcriptional regulator